MYDVLLENQFYMIKATGIVQDSQQELLSVPICLPASNRVNLIGIQFARSNKQVINIPLLIYIYLKDGFSVNYRYLLTLYSLIFLSPTNFFLLRIILTLHFDINKTFYKKYMLIFSNHSCGNSSLNKKKICVSKTTFTHVFHVPTILLIT